MLADDPRDTFLKYALAMELRKEGASPEAERAFGYEKEKVFI